MRAELSFSDPQAHRSPPLLPDLQDRALVARAAHGGDLRNVIRRDKSADFCEGVDVRFCRNAKLARASIRGTCRAGLGVLLGEYFGFMASVGVEHAEHTLAARARGGGPASDEQPPATALRQRDRQGRPCGLG